MEREAHQATHLPYRPWCEDCVAGKGHSRHHDEVKRAEEDQMTTVSIDDGFLGTKEELTPEECEGSDVIKILGVKDRNSKAVASHVVPSKGTRHPYPVKRVIRTLDEWGVGDINLKSDGEPAIMNVKAGIRAGRSESTLVEDAPRGDHQANGEAEAAIREIKGQARVLKSALERRVQSRIELRSPVIKWLVEYVGFLLTRYKVKGDGKTPYESLKGKRNKMELVDFGEKVMYEVPRAAGEPKSSIEMKFEPGLYMGVRSASQEYWIALRDGRVIKSRCIKRKPEEERWCLEDLLAVRGVPWDPLVEDGPIAPGKAAPGPVPLRERQHEVVPRKIYLTGAVLAKHGVTEGCKGCAAWQIKKAGATQRSVSNENRGSHCSRERRSEGGA